MSVVSEILLALFILSFIHNLITGYILRVIAKGYGFAQDYFFRAAADQIRLCLMLRRDRDSISDKERKFLIYSIISSIIQISLFLAFMLSLVILSSDWFNSLVRENQL